MESDKPIKNAAIALIGSNRFSPVGYSPPHHHPASTDSASA
jgi:hypothetical protein